MTYNRSYDPQIRALTPEEKIDEMTNQWTASAIAADIQASIDKIHQLMNSWHRGVESETGNHGYYRIHPENINYVIFIPDMMPEDYEGNVLPGSTIQPEG